LNPRRGRLASEFQHLERNGCPKGERFPSSEAAEPKISPFRYCAVEMSNLLHRDVDSHTDCGQLLSKFVISTGA
jgi:hypothetical protein